MKPRCELQPHCRFDAASLELQALLGVSQLENHWAYPLSHKMSKRSRLESMRNRILDFEKEIGERIEALLVYETGILDTGVLRAQWLASVSNSVGGDSQAFRKKLEILRTKSEFYSSQLTLENAKMEGFTESQSLGYLIAATKPYADGETEEKRKKSLEIVVQNNIEDLKDALNQCIAQRADITNNVRDLVHDVETLKFEHEQQNASVVGELERKISQYTEQLRDISATSKANDREITGDYLVLRHNSRVAKEMLVRSQNEANLARKVLQEGMDQVELASASQREKIEHSSEAELMELTDGIRLKVVKSEQELEELQASRIERLRSRKLKIRSLNKACDEFNYKYEELQAQRKNDLERVSGELKRLREMVEKVDLRLLKLNSADDDSHSQADKYFDNKENRLLERKSRVIIQDLEQRLKQLRHG